MHGATLGGSPKCEIAITIISCLAETTFLPVAVFESYTQVTHDKKRSNFLSLGAKFQRPKQYSWRGFIWGGVVTGDLLASNPGLATHFLCFTYEGPKAGKCAKVKSIVKNIAEEWRDGKTPSKIFAKNTER